MDRAMALVAGILRLGIDTGEFRPVPVEAAVVSIMGPVLMLALWQYAFAPAAVRPLDEPSILQAHLALLLDGLRPPDGGDGDAG